MIANAGGADTLDRMGDYIDWDAVPRLGRAVKRVNVDFPAQMVARLDKEAKRRGVTRQALIKMWLTDRLDQTA